MASLGSPIKDRHLREFRKAFADGRVGTGPEDPRRSKFFELQKVSTEEGQRICNVVADEIRAHRQASSSNKMSGTTAHQASPSIKGKSASHTSSNKGDAYRRQDSTVPAAKASQKPQQSSPANVILLSVPFLGRLHTIVKAATHLLPSNTRDRLMEELPNMNPVAILRSVSDALVSIPGGVQQCMQDLVEAAERRGEASGRRLEREEQQEAPKIRREAIRRRAILTIEHNSVCDPKTCEDTNCALRRKKKRTAHRNLLKQARQLSMEAPAPMNTKRRMSSNLNG